MLVFILGFIRSRFIQVSSLIFFMIFVIFILFWGLILFSLGYISADHRMRIISSQSKV